MPRIAAAIGTVVALAAALTACAAEPEPDPEWSEEAAYAEAEEVFREYWDVSLEGEVPKALLTPSMAAAEEDGRQELEDSGIEFRGKSEIETIERTGFRTVGESAVVTLRACIDASSFEMRTAESEWHQPRAEEKYGVETQLESRGAEMLVADLSEPEGIKC